MAQFRYSTELEAKEAAIAMSEETAASVSGNPDNVYTVIESGEAFYVEVNEDTMIRTWERLVARYTRGQEVK